MTVQLLNPIFEKSGLTGEVTNLEVLYGLFPNRHGSAAEGPETVAQRR